MTHDLEKLAAAPCACTDYFACQPCLARALLPRWRAMIAVEKAARIWRRQTALTESTKCYWPALEGIWDALEALDAAEVP